MNIYQRLHGVMQTIGYVPKEDKRVNGQYTFVSHDAVAARIRPALIQHGVLPVVSVERHVQEGNCTQVDLIVRFINVEKPEEAVEIRSFGYGVDPQDKGPGKAVSYAFKYALLKMFCLETGDDPERDSINYQAPSSKTVAADTWDKLPESERDILAELAADVSELLTAQHHTEAYQLIEEAQLDTDQKVALWSRFDSKQRRILKNFSRNEKGSNHHDHDQH